ncbi:MAG: N-acetyltransferase [Candidatus Eremiobacteraeota bacterium]|nr:N-acetyltransferase [Candidatus Eremiobacteraeota bacterium]
MQRPRRSATSLPRGAAEHLRVQTSDALALRRASEGDLEAIAAIYNQGIEDRVATLETEPKSRDEIEQWWQQHDDYYAVIVAVERGTVIGWASLNRFSGRCAHAEIADVSVYVERDFRGRGVGFALLSELEREARRNGLRKLVLHALDGNEQGRRLYGKARFREVGVFREHGRIDGRYVDVVAMERMLTGPEAGL